MYIKSYMYKTGCALGEFGSPIFLEIYIGLQKGEL